MRFILLSVGLGLLNMLSAQSIKGLVRDELGEGIPGITIQELNTNNGTFSDIDGSFSLQLVSGFPVKLKFSGIGYQDQNITLTSSKFFEIKLPTSTEQLESVQVVGKSEATVLREQPYAVTVVDVKALKSQNLDVNEVLGSVSGVRIRQQGGLGSSFDFSLNGFTGSQVKFFMDGIPMDNFGSSLSLNNIPINMINGIEVYKGVVPIHLGADALGGAVNITTDQQVSNYLNASYSVGSFNTHRAAVLTRYTESKTGLTFNANLFYNYSDNNYWMRGVEVPKSDGSGKLDTVDVRRFHDGYRSATAQIEIGVTNKPFADKLFIGLIASGNEKEVQTGLNNQDVFGEVMTTDQVLIPTLKYKKSDLFIKGLRLSAYGMLNQRQSARIDTSSRTYNWYGNYAIRINNAGEFTYNKSHFTFDDHSWLGSVNLSYDLNENHSFSINQSSSRFSRVGNDPMRDASEVPFTTPNTIEKSIYALSYQLQLLNGDWRTTTFVKKFLMHSFMRVEDNITYDLIALSRDFDLTGFGFASTYQLAKWVQLKLSYENTYRLPEGEEMFGNGLTVLPSSGLNPEQSSNYNLGILFSKYWRNHTLRVEANYLYREATDFIRLDASQPRNSNYVNQLAVNLQSLEGSVAYTFKRLIQLQVNVTKQKNTNADKVDRLFGDDLPNQPFLFGNASLGFQFHDLWMPGSKLSVQWYSLYVDMFYWKWPSQGNKRYKYDIPRQVSHDLSVTYVLSEGRYSLSAACSNITNALRYDNFAMQKPGRSFSLKINYFISKS